MPSWSEIEAEVPELCRFARERFDAYTHKTLATLRRDGSPRISGTELTFHAGDVWIGSMSQAVKALDLRRDPRFAIHSGSADPPEWPGDAKIAGLAHEVDDPELKAAIVGEESDAHAFRLDVTELVVVRLNDARDKLVVESWHAGRGVTRIER